MGVDAPGVTSAPWTRGCWTCHPGRDHYSDGRNPYRGAASDLTRREDTTSGCPAERTVAEERDDGFPELAHSWLASSGAAEPSGSRARRTRQAVDGPSQDRATSRPGHSSASGARSPRHRSSARNAPPYARGHPFPYNARRRRRCRSGGSLLKCSTNPPPARVSDQRMTHATDFRTGVDSGPRNGFVAT
jgi:hypothetical protein